MKTIKVYMIIPILTLLAACSQAPAAQVTSPLPTQPPSTSTPMPASADAIIGTWTSTVTKEDLLRVAPDFLQEYLCENAGTFVAQFHQGGKYEVDQTGLEGCPIPRQPHNEDVWHTEGNVLTFGELAGEQMTYEWRVQGDLLTLTYKAGECVPCKAVDTANPWKRVKK